MEIKNLSANPDNPRVITDEKLTLLKKALDEFGDLGGFVFNRRSGFLVGGHQRAKIFDKDTEIVFERSYTIPTRTGTVAEGHVIFNGERFKYREVDWDDFKEKAANIAANKGAGEWDLPKLGTWLKDLNDFGFDLDLTMFDELERTEFLELETPKDDREDQIPAAPKVPKSRLGDLYQLGEHRLLCGDSTDAKTVERLMGGKKADITFTSPPYNGNIEFNNVKNSGALYENNEDNMSSGDYVNFASTVLGLAIAHTNLYVFWNVNYNSNSRSEFIKQIIPFLDKLDETVCWKKTALPVPHGLTRTWEPIFIFRCFEDELRISNNKTEFNYWEISNIGALDASHRAAFPVALPEKAISLVAQCKSVFDPFGGSGSTLIACEKTKRKCFTMELDPVYCDVIVERWEAFTGLKAKLMRAVTRKVKDA